MAKRADKTVINFMANIMRRVGAENPTDLSKIMGVPWTERDQQRRLYKWAAGEQSPNFIGTISLLFAAGGLKWNPLEVESVPTIGWLDEAGIERREDDAPLVVAPRADPLEALRATVEAQGEAMTKALRALERANRDLARRLPPEVRPTKKAV